MTRRRAVSLEGATALVTGGSGGIGSCLVAGMTASGMRVTVADRMAPPAGTASVTVDLSRPESVHELGRQLQQSPPDVLVNLAGLNWFGGFDTMEAGRLEALLQVNLLAPVRLVHAVLPAMLARGSGHIVNIGSVVGDIGLPYFSAYAASKSGIECFSESLRRELAGRGIDVTYVAPRAVQTAMNEGAIERFNQRSGARADAPEYVAGVILDAIARRRARVTVGWPEKLFVKVNGLFPRVVDRALIRNRRLADEVLAEFE